MEHDQRNMYQLPENAELIGVYGVKDEWENLSTFGFLVKVKSVEASYTCPAFTPEPVDTEEDCEEEEHEAEPRRNRRN